MPISKPDHVQVHRIEFGKGTNINGLVKELETSAKHIRYGAYATAGALGLTAAGLTYGLYKLGQGIADAWEDFSLPSIQAGYEDFMNPETGPSITLFSPRWWRENFWNRI